MVGKNDNNNQRADEANRVERPNEQEQKAMVDKMVEDPFLTLAKLCIMIEKMKLDGENEQMIKDTEHMRSVIARGILKVRGYPAAQLL